MNSDFQEAFEDRCPDIQIVYDHFHIIKNFNEKVVSEIRKDEQKRLLDAGDKQGAKALKGSKYILTSKRSTLRKKDREASEGKIIQNCNLSTWSLETFCKVLNIYHLKITSFFEIFIAL